MKQLHFSFISQLLELCEHCLGQHQQIKFNFYLSHQKHAIRIIYDKDHFAPTKSLFKYAKALKVYEIKLFQILSLIFKCKTEPSHSFFYSLCTLKPPSKFFLQTDNLLPLTLKRTKFGQFSIYFRGPYLWNKILAKKNFHQ